MSKIFDDFDLDVQKVSIEYYSVEPREVTITPITVTSDRQSCWAHCDGNITRTCPETIAHTCGCTGGNCIVNTNGCR